MPTVPFNPFNPFSYWTLGAAGRASSTSSAARGAPIAIKTESSDPGLKVKSGKNQVTITGKTRGDLQPVDGFGVPVPYTVARGMSFTLDIDKAPTTNAFGRTDYTEKNSRLFTLTTSPGWTAEECARRLAAKVNANDDFRATVKVAATGAATVEFTRR